MAQKQYTTYQADVLSFELRDAPLGVIKPGRYIGYDDMSQNTPPAAGDIILDFDHTNGIPKYDQTNPTPVIENTRGVAVTTQGVIIAEDQTVTQTLTFINHASGGYHILYMNHAYLSGTPGANAATYGIKSGSGGGGLPTLDFPTRQVIIGVIQEAPNGAVFGDLTYHPYHPGVGDTNLHDKLFRTSVNKAFAEGTLPANGIIGNRNFSSNQYITDYESLTDVLGDLDAAILARAGDITTLQGTKLDDWATPDNNTDLNVTASYHGLCPVLPSTDPTLKFLRGDGTFTVPPGGRFVMRSGSFSDDVNISTPVAVNQIDLQGVGGCPADADMLIVDFHISTLSLPSGSWVSAWLRKGTSGGWNARIQALNQSAGTTNYDYRFQVIVPCDTSQNFYIDIIQGLTYCYAINVSLVGWQTYTP